MTDPHKKIFRGCSSVDEKLRALADRFVDAAEWRLEEAQLLNNFEERLSKVEKIVEDGPGQRTYSMMKAREGKE